MRIYIAGPYSPRKCSLHDAPRIAQQNTDKALEIFNALVEKGHDPYAPHISHYIHVHYSCKRDYGDWWYEYDNTFLEYWAEALFFLGSSKGANAELCLAHKLGLKIFHSLEDVPNAQK